jgi:hypothetical protein
MKGSGSYQEHNGVGSALNEQLQRERAGKQQYRSQRLHAFTFPTEEIIRTAARSSGLRSLRVAPARSTQPGLCL